jgi:hypothetical protein
MLEKEVEKHLVDIVKAGGGLAPKFTSPQRRSVPDRLVLLGTGRAAARLQRAFSRAGVEISAGDAHAIAKEVIASAIQFCELKAPGKKPTDGQLREHERLRALGFVVRVIDTKEGVDAAYGKGR